MTRANKFVVLALISVLGLVGCVFGAAEGKADRTKVLEEKVAQLEQDFLAAAAARDQFRAKLEQEMAQLKLVVKERDELGQQLAVRTGERDLVQGQYDQFRKALRDLLADAETANSRAAESVTSAAAVKVAGNS